MRTFLLILCLGMLWSQMAFARLLPGGLVIEDTPQVQQVHVSDGYQMLLIFPEDMICPRTELLGFTRTPLVFELNELQDMMSLVDLRTSNVRDVYLQVQQYINIRVLIAKIASLNAIEEMCDPETTCPPMEKIHGASTEVLLYAQSVQSSCFLEKRMQEWQHDLEKAWAKRFATDITAHVCKKYRKGDPYLERYCPMVEKL